MCSEWGQAARELEEWWRKGTRPEEGSGIEMPQLRSSGLPHLHSPYLAVCRSLSLFQSQKQTRLYEANHIVLGKTPIFSGERKGKRPIWSRDCMRFCRSRDGCCRFWGSVGRREACECLASKAPKNRPSPGRTDNSSRRTGCRGCHCSTSSVPIPTLDKRRNGTQFWPPSSPATVLRDSPPRQS